MGAHRTRRDVQRCANLLVRLSRSDELGDLAFAPCEGAGAFGDGFGRRTRPELAQLLARATELGLGADAITLGNHAYRHREVYEYLDREPRIIRPANFPKGSPGRGHTVVEANGLRLGVINLSGQVFVEAARSPFAEADALALNDTLIDALACT